MADTIEFSTPELEKAKKTIEDMEAQLKELKTQYRIMELENKVVVLEEVREFLNKKLAHETELNRWRKHHHAAAKEEVRLLRSEGKQLPKTDSSDEEW